MSELTEALEKLSYWIENSQSSHARLIRNHPSVDIRLKPGLEKEMIELYVEEMNFDLPEEVYELYQWHNGSFKIEDYANPVFFKSLENSFDYIEVENYLINIV